jgi:hypothetical protein
MRMLFQSPPIRTKHKHHITGAVVDGTAQFTAAVYEPGEQVPSSPGAPRGFLMREWRSRLRPGQPIGMGQLKEIYIGLPLVEVPLELTDALPDDATLAISWTFVPGAMKL